MVAAPDEWEMTNGTHRVGVTEAWRGRSSRDQKVGSLAVPTPPGTRPRAAERIPDEGDGLPAETTLPGTSPRSAESPSSTSAELASQGPSRTTASRGS
jgi:hypothetical protein